MTFIFGEMSNNAHEKKIGEASEFFSQQFLFFFSRPFLTVAKAVWICKIIAASFAVMNPAAFAKLDCIPDDAWRHKSVATCFDNIVICLINRTG